MIPWLTWQGFLRALVAGLALVTVAGYFGDHAWWLDVLADFKTQTAIGAGVSVAWAAVARRGKEAALALALLVINGSTVAPYLRSASEGPSTIKIIEFNVSILNDDTASALAYLRRENADVVVVTEVTEYWRKEFERLSDIYPNRFYGPIDRRLKKYPNTIGLLAKRAWEEVKAEWSDSSARAFAVWARFPAASPSLTVAGVHLMNPVTNPVRYQRSEAKALAAMVRRFEGPVVVAGDFNMTPFATRYRNLLQKADLRRASGGVNSTWPSLLGPLGLPLDHFLISSEVRPATMRTGPRLGSDHLPIVGTFGLGN